MTKSSFKSNKRFSLGFDAELADKITYLSRLTGKSKVDLLRLFIEPNFEVACMLDSGNVWQFVSGSQITYQWFGKSRMISGKNSLDDDSTTAKMNSEIKKKLLKEVA